MQEKHLFEYAVLRIVPRVEREEFMNTGVILYCSSQRFLQVIYELKVDRLQAFCNELDVQVLAKRLHAFEQICVGKNQGGPIGNLPLASRFRWLTAARSTVLQTSPVHPGLCVDASTALLQLHKQLVL